MKKFDASVPRKMFWSDKVPNKLRCPLCRSKLEKESSTYLVAMKTHEEFESFIMGNDFGSFCTRCPVVMLDRDQFSGLLAESVKSSGGALKFEFTVLGIIDLEAIPDDKKDVPIGNDDNPIPLVEFVETIERTEQGGEGQPSSKRLSGNQRRRLRKLQDAADE